MLGSVLLSGVLFDIDEANSIEDVINLNVTIPKGGDTYIYVAIASKISNSNYEDAYYYFVATYRLDGAYELYTVPFATLYVQNQRETYRDVVNSLK